MVPAHLENNKKSIAAIKKEIEEIDGTIKKLNSSVKIIGVLDQDGNLIIGQDEALPEAVARQRKLENLKEKKKELKKLIAKE